MKNNVYVRNNKSIFTISLVRILLLIPLIIYGFYKNGIYLYNKGYTSLFGMFKPLVFVIGGGVIGLLVNLIYEYFIKKNKDSLINNLFSSFHIEYGIVLGCLMPVSINAVIFFSVLFVSLFISKFFKNRINIMCVTFLLIYTLSYLITKNFEFANNYELSKAFHFEITDYLIGKAPGGIASTNIVLLFVSLIGLTLTNNSKTTISYISMLGLLVLFGIYAMIQNVNLCTLVFTNNLFFVFTYVATDSVSSSYTKYGKRIYGLFISILSFGLYFINPVIAPFIAILIVSILNNVIDRHISKLFHKEIVKN